ncbi:hypothetical protein C9374_013855 [Naegleria lovaniensis]|uniref:WH2 domain-containing protein n=1 Tax=Naegleria lovaniensis TaxID=51637 RepID=A0AA88GYB6_NAELO|nr:uncharacterized protein C9374_013855 [Naegleria lovaniensis]KAG2389295.1 hypothetical protein C9374_013855 [Naegleria lovaniensis]
MAQNIYEFPVLYQHNRIENIQQMLDALEHLERVSVSVFQRITDKVNEHRNILNQVQRRAIVAQQAVECIQNERKNEATRVLSSPHYPDKETISSDEYKPSFSLRDRIGIQQMEFHKYNPGPNNILYNHKRYNPIDHFEKSPTRQHKQQKSKASLALAKKVEDGIGKLPFNHIQSVSELLCFNTNMNVYSRYHGADPLLANYHTTMMMLAMSDEKSGNSHDGKGGANSGNAHDFLSAASSLYIDPAPPSLSKDSIYDMYWGSSALQEQNIKPFVPTIRELPMFEFPSNLGLPNIVDTKQWDLSLDNMPSIAPSSLPSLDLGSTSSGTAIASTPEMVPSTASTTNAGVPPPPVTSGSVPPPPTMTSGSIPPPPTMGGNIPPPTMGGNIPPPPTTMGNIPPPPTSTIPTPPVAVVSSAETGGDADATANNAEDGGGGGGGDRSDLLASIRNFSKNKLKKANKYRDKETSKEDSAPQKSSGGGGDMMSDLFRKISLRRNAIEGSKDDNKKKKKKKDKKESSDIIPPPQPASSTPTTTTPTTTAADSSAATELPVIPPPSRPPEEDGSSESEDDSW